MGVWVSCVLLFGPLEKLLHCVSEAGDRLLLFNFQADFTAGEFGSIGVAS